MNDKRIAVVGVVAVAMTVVATIPFGAWAQQGDRGGMLFKLSLAERFMARSAESTNPTQDGDTTQLTTDVGFSLSSETRTESFTLDAKTGFRFVDGPTTDGTETAFTTPSVTLGYTRAAATSNLRLGLRAQQSDLADVSAVDAVDDDGTPITSDSGTFLDGGTQTQLGFSARLAIREDAPFGLVFNLSADDLRYDDLPEGSTTLDRTAVRFSTTGRFDIHPALQARLGLSYDAVDRHGGTRSDRYGLKGQMLMARPNGNINVSARVSDGDGGVQSGLSFGRGFELPQSKLDFAVGATLSASEDIVATGSATLKHEFADDSPLGAVSLTAERDLAFNDADVEEVTTSLSLAGNYAINPMADLNLSAGLGQAEGVTSGDRVTVSEVGLALGYQFDRNWRGSAGIRAEQRVGDDLTDASSTTLSLGLSRTFERWR